MLKKLLHRTIAAFERRYDYDMRYAHQLVDARSRAFLLFLPVTWMSAYRDDVPVGPWFGAKLATILAEDCGPCTQLTLHMAEEAGVPAAVLRALLTGARARVDADTLLGFDFAHALATGDAAAAELREAVRARWGDRGLAAFALNIAATRVYPTLKGVLGHGEQCGLLHLGDGGAPLRAAPPLAAGGSRP